MLETNSGPNIAVFKISASKEKISKKIRRPLAFFVSFLGNAKKEKSRNSKVILNREIGLGPGLKPIPLLALPIFFLLLVQFFKPIRLWGTYPT